jgi:hypothetical protein
MRRFVTLALFLSRPSLTLDQPRLCASRVNKRCPVVDPGIATNPTGDDAPVLDVDVVYLPDGRPDGLVGEPDSMQPLPIDVLGAGESKTLSVLYFSADPRAVVTTNDYFREQRDEVTITLTDSKGRRWRGR